MPKRQQKTVGSVRLIGERWTEGELSDAKHAWATMVEGVPCTLPFDRMRLLKRRGLLSLLDGGSREYQYIWSPKLERLVKAAHRIETTVL